MRCGEGAEIRHGAVLPFVTFPYRQPVSELYRCQGVSGALL